MERADQSACRTDVWTKIQESTVRILALMHNINFVVFVVCLMSGDEAVVFVGVAARRTSSSPS